MSMTIHRDCSVSIDGKKTGYNVKQARFGTVVWREGKLVENMPSNRYSLTTYEPVSGQPGRLELERDIRNLL